MKDAFTSLEFSKIEEGLDQYFAFRENVSLFHDEPLITNDNVIDTEHAYLNECVDFLKKGYQISLLETGEIKPSLSLLSKGAILSIASLAEFTPFIDNIETLISALKGKTFLTRLNDLSLDLVGYRNIGDRIRNAILPDLTIADEASPTLYDIRRKIEKAEASISDVLKNAASKYSSYLAINTETMKNGMPALAVKAGDKNKVKGLVADISNTGNTVFIVPMEVLDIQNKVFELKEDERDEINRILKELSSVLTSNLEGLVKDYNIALRIDSLFARVKFGLSYKGCVAINSDEIGLEDLSHPLLNQDTVVRNNISLGGKKAKILVISGPNAGGKTVLIKAVTLACLMNQKGLLVACLGEARLRLFDSFYFLSGDSQSIMDSLSTFSGHITMIKEALDKIDENSLLVIDEIGQGTAPNDGEAIGVAVIDYLKKIGCYSILTSHYDGIKEKAFEDKDCLIGAMVFDEKTIRPTFKYQEGMIGKSYALEVSANMGLNKDVIKEAQEYIASKKTSKESQALDQILSLQQENLALKEDYLKKIEEAKALTEKRQRALDALNAEKMSIAKKAEDRIEALVREREEQLDLAFKEKKVSLGDLAKLKGQMNKISSEKKKGIGEVNEKEERHIFKIGDRVMVKSMNNSGEIVLLNPNKGTASININGLVLKTDVSDLTYLGREVIDNTPKVATQDKYIEYKNSASLSVNLIGMRQDEARKVLLQYLDDCMLNKLHQVIIIHGIGTGALRNMVANELKKNKNVVSSRLGYPMEGGVGVTVVDLK